MPLTKSQLAALSKASLYLLDAFQAAEKHFKEPVQLNRVELIHWLCRVAPNLKDRFGLDKKRQLVRVRTFIASAQEDLILSRSDTGHGGRVSGDEYQLGTYELTDKGREYADLPPLTAAQRAMGGTHGS